MVGDDAHSARVGLQSTLVGRVADRSAGGIGLEAIRVLEQMMRMARGRGAGVPSGDGLDLVNDDAQRVNVVVVRDALQHRAHALQAGARVDGGVRQREQVARCQHVSGCDIARQRVLNEHEVPQLDATLVLGRIGDGRRGDRRVLDVVDLAALADGRATRQRHLPQVVLVRAPIRRHVMVAMPDRRRLVVGMVHRHHESLSRQLQLARQEAPRVLDGVGLPVRRAESKVTEHLEERMVSR